VHSVSTISFLKAKLLMRGNRPKLFPTNIAK
jgi:hypothetical protein